MKNSIEDTIYSKNFEDSIFKNVNHIFMNSSIYSAYGEIVDYIKELSLALTQEQINIISEQQSKGIGFIFPIDQGRGINNKRTSRHESIIKDNNDFMRSPRCSEEIIKLLTLCDGIKKALKDNKKIIADSRREFVEALTKIPKEKSLKIIELAGSDSKANFVKFIYDRILHIPDNLRNGLAVPYMEYQRALASSSKKLISNIEAIERFAIENSSEILLSKKSLIRKVGVNVFDDSAWREYIIKSISHHNLYDVITIEWQSNELKSEFSGLIEINNFIDNLVLSFIEYTVERRIANLEVDLLNTSGHEFEIIIKRELDKIQGIKVDTTRASGDFGADLVIRSETKTMVAQLKRYKGSVGISAVQEIFGSIKHYNADCGIVISTGRYTKAAISLADSTGIILCNENNYREVVVKYFGLDYEI